MPVDTLDIFLLAALTAAATGLGALPFLFGDAVKIATAAWIARGMRATSFGDL